MYIEIYMTLKERDKEGKDKKKNFKEEQSGFITKGNEESETKLRPFSKGWNYLLETVSNIWNYGTTKNLIITLDDEGLSITTIEISLFPKMFY